MTASADRARGALWGLAVGDALGMPTQELPRDRAAAVVAAAGTWPQLVDGPLDQPVAPGLPAGTVTDDTEQAVLVGRLLVAGAGTVSPRALAEGLVAWQADMASRGRSDLLGPSTRAAVDAVLAGGDPDEVSYPGTTNGAAMRVAPVGVAVPPEPLDRLVDAVVAVGRVSHDSGLAHAGAAAVAAAVSAGVAGASFDEAVEVAVAAARAAQRRGQWVAGPEVAQRLRWAVSLVREAPDQASALDLVDGLVGTGLPAAETVPAAFAVVALSPDDPWRAAGLAAALGGDADTVAAVAGAVAGAVTGLDRLPPEAVATVARVNGLDLDPLARDLLELREGAR